MSFHQDGRPSSCHTSARRSCPLCLQSKSIHCLSTTFNNPTYLQIMHHRPVNTSIFLLTITNLTLTQSVNIVSKSLVFLFLILWAGMTSAQCSLPRSSSSYTLVQHTFNTLQDCGLQAALLSSALHQCFHHQQVTYCLYMQCPSHPHFSTPQSLLLCQHLSLIPQPHQMVLSGDSASDGQGSTPGCQCANPHPDPSNLLPADPGVWVIPTARRVLTPSG